MFGILPRTLVRYDFSNMARKIIVPYADRYIENNFNEIIAQYTTLVLRINIHARKYVSIKKRIKWCIYQYTYYLIATLAILAFRRLT